MTGWETQKQEVFDATTATHQVDRKRPIIFKPTLPHVPDIGRSIESWIKLRYIVSVPRAFFGVASWIR